jgi:hypothetical protein
VAAVVAAVAATAAFDNDFQDTKESKKLASFMLLAEEEIPPAMVHLRHLLNNNMAVLGSKGQKRCLWHPAVLEACCVIFSSSRVAYAEVYQSGLSALLTPEEAGLGKGQIRFGPIYRQVHQGHKLKAT